MIRDSMRPQSCPVPIPWLTADRQIEPRHGIGLASMGIARQRLALAALIVDNFMPSTSPQPIARGIEFGIFNLTLRRPIGN